MQRQFRLLIQRAEKHIFMFGEGTLISNSCPPGMMCKLDSPWLCPYLFVCLVGWPFGIRVHADLAVIRVYCLDLGRKSQAPSSVFIYHHNCITSSQIPLGHNPFLSLMQQRQILDRSLSHRRQNISAIYWTCFHLRRL